MRGYSALLALAALAGCGGGTMLPPPAAPCPRTQPSAHPPAASGHPTRAQKLAQRCADGDQGACGTLSAALDRAADSHTAPAAATAGPNRGGSTGANHGAATDTSSKPVANANHGAATTDAAKAPSGPTTDHQLATRCERDQNTASCTALGERLLHDPGAASLDAPRYLHLACDGGDAGACNDLGWAYDNQFGALTDRSKAAPLFERACRLGNTLGCVNRGRVVRDSNSADAADFFNQACSQGDHEGCKLLAGTVEQARAACAKKAADCNNWGWLLEQGIGVKKNVRAGIAAYRKACYAHAPVACFNVGVAARDGKAGAPARRTAKTYFVRACRAGDDSACLAANELAKRQPRSK